MDSKSRKNMKKNMTAFSFVMCIFIIGAMAVYYQYMKKQQQTAVQTPTTEVEKLIAKDFEMGYPETPVEVMKLWGRVNQCMYNSTLSDSQFTSLLKQLRAMYSNDLLNENKEEEHSKKLKAEIEEFQSKKGKIVSYSTDTGMTTRYQTINGKECAYARLSFFANKGGGYVKIFQDYVLVRESGKWKILGFQPNEEKSAKKGEK